VDLIYSSPHGMSSHGLTFHVAGLLLNWVIPDSSSECQFHSL